MEATATAIKTLDAGSIHSLTSGQVVVDLQTAVKELLENSLDAGATSIDVRFKDYGLDSFEVVDNGSGIAPADYDSIALKHHTSKLASFSDLDHVSTFGFRGEALSSLCALARAVSVTTATAIEAPVGTVLSFDRSGKLSSRKGKAARPRGTTVTVSGLFAPLPVRRKELERNAKREYAKALSLLHAYALVPCSREHAPVRLSVSNILPGGSRTPQLRTDGTPSTRAAVSALWGPRALDHLVDLDLAFSVPIDAAVRRRLGKTHEDGDANEVKVRGLISKFAVGCGRTGTDRQFFFVNGRPCAPAKVQKAFNEVYHSFNATQAPFIVADFILPTDACDVNVSPDKRTILLHSEHNLVEALKAALEEKYAPARSTFDVNAPQAQTQMKMPSQAASRKTTNAPNTGEDVDADAEASTSSGADSSQAGQGSSNEKEPLFLSDGQDEPQLSELVEGRPRIPDELEEVTFGEPTLLTGSVPSPHAHSPLGSFVDADTDAEPAHRAGQANEYTTAADAAQPAPLDTPPHRTRARKPTSRTRSPTLTQMLRRPRSSAVTEEEHDAGDVEDVLMPDQDAALGDRPSPSRPRARLSRSSLSSLPTNDLPIPAVKPPARPTVRPSSQPTTAAAALSKGSRRPAKGEGSQMVLSTAGASWSLRRPAADSDGDSDGEPPRKRGRVDDSEAAARGRGARAGMREMLRGFARQGSKVDEAPMDVDADVEGGDECQDEVEADGGDIVSDARDMGNDVQHALTPGVTPEIVPDVDMADGLYTGDDVMEVLDDDTESRPVASDLGASSTVTTNTTSTTTTNTTTKHEIVRTEAFEDDLVSLAFDGARVASAWNMLRARRALPLHEEEKRDDDTRGTDQSGPAGSIDASDEDAAAALSRVIDKADFAAMDIVGQFNLGFIVVRRRTRAGSGQEATGTDDLFIVDQHAADEKYNFETLQQTTRIASQRLFRPQVLELTAADELVARENVNVLRLNGFELDDMGDARAPGQRVRLVAQPMSKSTVFDTKDLEELLHLLHDCPAGQMVRCSKARAMFAMRACRKSIMIGTPLSRRQMMSVVRHMGTMDQPWHCPHGRPTMRHLSDIAGAGWHLPGQERAAGSVGGRSVDWAAFDRAASGL
ncbi:hypothetical protein C8Q79DRAFT_920459 [Trametes meyenii]|nr:hypothetical protein C8Q79DRAFT_920459 [Trametes meyenii]